MSAVVLAGLELTSGAEPTAIITEDSEVPRSAICHITRATLVPTSTPASSASTFYLKASISDSQDIVLGTVSSSAPSVALDLVFHADSTPMFSVTSVPELKPDHVDKFTVHLSGYVDVEVEEDEMDDMEDEDDEDGEEGEEEELTAEEMAAMREAIKRGEFDNDDDEDDDDDEEGEGEDDEEGDEDAEAGAEMDDDEDDEDDEEKTAPAPAKKGAAAAPAANKRKQSPTETAPPTKQQKTAASTASSTSTPAASASTKQQQQQQKQQQPQQAKSAKQPTTAAASSPAATVLPSGLTIQDEKLGTGAAAQNGRKVSIRYRGELVSNGKVFDSNMPKGKPFDFTLGGGECIEGFDKGVKGMKVGGRRVIVVPSELGYGKKGSPPTIPPNAALRFTIELLKA